MTDSYHCIIKLLESLLLYCNIFLYILPDNKYCSAHLLKLSYTYTRNIRRCLTAARLLIRSRPQKKHLQEYRSHGSQHFLSQYSIIGQSLLSLWFSSKYCTRDVSRNFHIICAEPVCVNSKGGVRLCGDCLHLSIATHLPSHPYTVVDCMQIPIFSKDWTILEELVLLAGEYHHVCSGNSCSDLPCNRY
jgi:hypothetical protein